MDLKADISLLVCCFLQVTFGQNFEALLSSLSRFSGGNDMYQGLGGTGMGFGGGAGGASPCPYNPHPDRFKFTQRVNDQTFVRTCAPGTMYDAQTCGCVNIPTSASAGQRGGSSLRPGANNMATINDLVKQMQNRAMRPPTPSRAPAAPRPQPLKPKSRSPSNHMDAIRQLADTPQAFVPGSIALDLFKVPSAGTAEPTRYTPSPMPALMSASDLSVLSRGISDSPSMPVDILSMFKNSALPQYRRQNSTNFSTKLSPKASLLQESVAKVPTDMHKIPKQPAAGVPVETTKSHQLQTKRYPSNGIPLYKKVPKLANPDTDPLATLLMELSRHPEPLPMEQPQQELTKPAKTGLTGLTSLPANNLYAALLAGRGGSLGGVNTAALLRALGGGAMGGGAGGGGGADMSTLLAALSGSSGTPSLGESAQSLLTLRSLSGNLQAPSLLGETPGTVDMTSMFNMQGRTNGPMGLAGLSGINMARLQELDRQGVIDLSDLSPAGAAAASRHFQG